MNEETPVTVLENPLESHPESTESQRVSELLTELPQEISRRPAWLLERFAAFFTDSLIFFYLLGGWALVLKYLLRGDLADPFSFHGTGKILFASTGAALHFLYYLFFEGVLTATPGKMLAGLSIQKKGGGSPSLIAIFLRNLLRVIDYPLFFITGIGLIEATHRGQRLGDLLAGTVVVREIPFEGRRIDPEKTELAGATRRSLAFVADLPLLLPFFYGLLLILPAERPLVSMVTLNLVPAATLLYLTLSEFLFQTTFGKALFGMKVVQEDGRPARFAMLLVRNSFRLFDTNPIGYLCTALSSRKQRPGDIAAGTIVVRDRRGIRGWLSIPFMAVLAITIAYLGYIHPGSFLKKNVQIRVAGYRFDPVPISIRRLTLRHLYIEDLEFGFNEEEVNRKGLYDPGNIIYLLATVSGYAVKNDRAWIQGDVKVQDANRNIVLDRINIINASLPVAHRKSVKLATRFALHPEATPGRYEVTFTLRDLFGQRKLEERKSFTVRP